MKIFWRVALLVEIFGLVALTVDFFRLPQIPELSASRQPFISATMVPEVVAPAMTIPHQPVDQPWTMLAVGDIMLDRYVRTVMKTKGVNFPFTVIKSELAGHDVVLGNLEGPFTNHATVATETRLIFTFDPVAAPAIAAAGMTDVSLANNHTLNFGQAGLDQTRKVVKSAKIHYFGDPKNRQGFGFIREVAGRKIAFIGYIGLAKGLNIILDEIIAAGQKADVVIVMAHWGNEYQLKFNSRQQSDAHKFIDAGADLVLGAHPHVVQPFEIYKDKFIAYSLGNFIFDQYFSKDTLEGLMIKLTFSADNFVATLIPIVTERGQIHLLTGARHDTLLKRLAADSVIPEAMRADVLRGQLKHPAL